MKLAVAGKGGVGKTTLVALLAREAVARGYRALAVDADPDANLATTLGFPEPVAPLAEERELIADRAGSGGLIKLNPTVDDIPDQYAVKRDGISLLVLGGIRQGGGGCACPENSFLRGLLMHLLLERDELVLVDMEAGIEHLGRGTVEAVDVLLVVVEADKRTMETAVRTIRLAHEIGLERIMAVGNRIRSPAEEIAIREMLPGGLPLLGGLPYLDGLRADAYTGCLPVGPPPPTLQELFDRLEEFIAPMQ
jgi:CO dehydrogenase maturation factor